MKHTPRQIKDILKEVATENNVDFLLVEELYYHEFEFLRDCMELGIKDEPDTFQTILLKHLGTFVACKDKIKRIGESKRKGIDCRNTESKSCPEEEQEHDNVDLLKQEV